MSPSKEKSLENIRSFIYGVSSGEKVQEQLWKLWHFAGTDFYYREQVDAAKAIESIVPGKYPFFHIWCKRWCG